MLEIDQLTVKRDQQTLRYQVQVEAGEILAIQGCSGVGKSTLLGVIAGFVTPTGGSLRWQGQDLLTRPPEQRPVSMLFQDNNLFEHISALDNLKLGFDGPPPLRAIEDAASSLGVSDLLHKKPATLSGGQRQRIAIIRTLLRPEPIVLLDEPFAELDQQTRGIASDWVAAIARQSDKTLLLVTHQQEDVTRLADRALVL
ncbi:ATP-binding cassette domain-containing protein [Marinobacterium jannaschii]|uniref:ATP-binding cassette domain-containing protein n=1 Tax=Marinobacterium jannaschii TaxID=64970 RepID=UPI000481591E|nr:ATP-binding cassette domain-containing protein [Marinobacterium jannaschii]